MEGIDNTADLPPLDPPSPEVDSFASPQDAGAQPSLPVQAPASTPQFDPHELARIMAQENARTLERFAPKPESPKQPWQDPSYYDLRGINPEQGLTEYHRRHNEHMAAVAKQAAEDAEKRLRDEFRGALQGQSAYFNTLYKPEHGAYRAHLDKYLNMGMPEEFAARLAKQDAGVSNAPAANGPRSVPTPPRHATSPATRSPSASTAAKPLNIFDKNAVREAGRKQALALGYHPDEID